VELPGNNLKIDLVSHVIIETSLALCGIAAMHEIITRELPVDAIEACYHGAGRRVRVSRA